MHCGWAKARQVVRNAWSASRCKGKKFDVRDGQPEESAGHDDSGASGDQERGYLCLFGGLSAFINMTRRASETLRLEGSFDALQKP